jgi:3-oxoacid CoA-transferase
VANSISKCIASVVPYQSFPTRNGDIFVGGANDRLFGILCERLGKKEWASDPRFKSNSDRVANRAVLEALIESETSKLDTAEWQRRFEGSGLPFAVVNDVKETMEHEHGILSFPFRSITAFCTGVS